MKIEELWKSATTEADWLRYYGYRESRLNETFVDVDFYDRITSIGYTKRVIPLSQRCIMLYISSEKPVLESEVEELFPVSGPRNHIENVYSALEYMIARRIRKEELIQMIKN